MEHTNGDPAPAELVRVAERLRSERTTASPLELDRIKRRVLRQAGRRTESRRGELMKSRLVLTTMIVLGAMMGGTGAGLAITGTSGEGNAAQNQYTTPGTDRGPQLAPEQLGGDDGAPPPAPPAEAPSVQGGQQVAAAAEEGGTLPFTGFLAIPLMIGGVALVGGGAVLRHRARDSE